MAANRADNLKMIKLKINLSKKIWSILKNFAKQCSCTLRGASYTTSALLISQIPCASSQPERRKPKTGLNVPEPKKSKMIWTLTSPPLKWSTGSRSVNTWSLRSGILTNLNLLRAWATLKPLWAKSWQPNNRFLKSSLKTPTTKIMNLVSSWELSRPRSLKHPILNHQNLSCQLRPHSLTTWEVGGRFHSPLQSITQLPTANPLTKTHFTLWGQQTNTKQLLTWLEVFWSLTTLTRSILCSASVANQPSWTRPKSVTPSH